MLVSHLNDKIDDFKFDMSSSSTAASSSNQATEEIVTLRWHNLTYEILPKRKFTFKKDQKKPIKILDGVSGHVKRGELVAILGPSGMINSLT